MTTGISDSEGYGLVIWIDRGGTFTDIITRDALGRMRTLKLLSTSPAYEDAAVEGMRRLLDVPKGAPFPAERVAAIKMGTTVATNALLERKGAKTLFVTTKGFADALVIGDQARPSLFALDIVKPEPLYSGVVEADERLDAAGGEVRPLDLERLRQDLARAKADGFTSAAIAFLHADLNPAHEKAAGEIAEALGFDLVALSHEVSPLPRFLPRAETTVADAYLTPALRAYVRRVAGAVNGAPLYFMTSSGGLVRAEAFRGRDAVVSGPAGGVVGVARTAIAAGAEAVLGFDMGGTSTDVCRFAGTLERRDTARIAGVRLRGPMLDVETVAAGGGSILTFDGLRARVGPDSAGADPGPAAYGRGGPATVTDANLVLGRIDPAAFPSLFGPNQDQPLDAAASRARLAVLAQAMGAESPEAAAEGFVRVCVEQTAQAVHRISTERGFDPRGHALVAFGGAAGQIACWVAEALGVDEVLSPRYASLLSAWGIGQAQVRSLRQAGVERRLDAEGHAQAMALGADLAAQALADLQAQGAELGELSTRLHLKYEGADATIPIEAGELAAMTQAFAAAHERLFGFIEPALPVLIASVEVEAEAAADPHFVTAEPAPRQAVDQRTIPMTSDGKTERAPVISADALGAASPLHHASHGPPPPKGEELDPGQLQSHSSPIGGGEPRSGGGGPSTVPGPALIVRGDTQIAVAPGWRAALAEDGLIRLTRMDRKAAKSAAADLTTPDPVTLELFNRRFMGVAEAMGAALERTAHSVNIKERLDFSCALFDAEGGLVANAPHMPVHLGSMGASVRAVRDRHPVLSPGEAFALNNPYAGGTHLPDITVVMPIFAGADQARPAFYVAARGHHADVGGVQPGSMPPFSRTIDEEGVLLDALPIMREGRFLEGQTRAALTAGPWPARKPDQNLADLKAQIAACQAGAAQVSAMIAAHGDETVARYMGFVQDNAEALVRRAI
ncbi:MAG: hydantoinase/oxoprolinase family protein, partial [Caulobacteraceae bacterium]|nr:hydantoinase/oxoprolinase family protein [Caulobacteraceae bacterium]